MNIEETVKAELCHASQNSLAINDIKNTDKLTDLNIDSLGIVEVIMNLETEYDLDIPDEDIEKLRTVKEVIELIELNCG
jgi:acyl carrier protein